MQAVILAGGRGTRIREIAGDLPKPLIPLEGKPLLVWQLEMLARYGVTDVLLLTGYRAQLIRDTIADGAAFGLRVAYHEESAARPLGTAGAMLDALDLCENRFIVLYGDIMVNVDIARFIAWHVAHNADASLLVHPNGHPEDSDLISTDRENHITEFHPYPHPEHLYLPNIVNAALYVIEKASLLPWRAAWLQGKLGPCPDIAKNLFPAMLRSRASLFAYRSPEYVKDIGTPERYAKALTDLRSGRIKRSSLSHPQKAIFLDRDGTLNVEVGRVSSPDALMLIDGAAEAVRRINESNFRAIVVTNQPVIARGDCDEPTLAIIHAKLDTLLGRQGSYLDALYYCPHHPDKGYPGEIESLKIVCDCRKPAPGMLLQAQKDMNIDFSQSWLIGDTSSDIRTAHALDIKAALVETGHAGRDNRYNAQPDQRFPTLTEAVSWILLQDHKMNVT